MVLKHGILVVIYTKYSLDETCKQCGTAKCSGRAPSLDEVIGPWPPFQMNILEQNAARSIKTV